MGRMDFPISGIPEISGNVASLKVFTTAIGKLRVKPRRWGKESQT